MPFHDQPHSSLSLSPPSSSSSNSNSTPRPNSCGHLPAPPSHWTHYFAQELWLDHRLHKENDDDGDSSTARYHAYITPPANPQKDPLFVCHHGAGASGLSFARFAQELRIRLPSAGILSLEARGHGSVVTNNTTATADAGESPDFSLPTMSADAETIISLTRAHFSWPSLPPTILIGHSLGGAVIVDLAHRRALGTSLVGFCVLDVVEGSAVEALGHMTTYLASRPAVFASEADAIHWHLRSRTLRDQASAAVSVPALLRIDDSGDGGGGPSYTWATPLGPTQPFWPTWFTGLSGRFLASRGAKLLVLAGADRLDKELMIGQMQGKFQLVVVPEAGHFVHEDAAARVADVVAEFWRRNDGGALVLPPKVSDLIAQGKKV